MTESSEAAGITDLLRAHREGNRDAFDAVVPLVYQRLRTLARAQVRRGGRGGALDTTGLVHEAYVQLVAETGVEWQDRGHFYAVCARAMRRILVDHARHRSARKRGGGEPEVTIVPGMAAVDQQVELVLAVDGALAKLSAFNERLARVVECRFFAGMTEEETAAAIQAPIRTVQRDWQRARAWLRRELE
jgi:RNA polymerase sigma factor (TIGR02999 family)